MNAFPNLLFSNPNPISSKNKHHSKPKILFTFFHNLHSRTPPFLILHPSPIFQFSPIRNLPFIHSKPQEPNFRNPIHPKLFKNRISKPFHAWPSTLIFIFHHLILFFIIKKLPKHLRNLVQSLTIPFKKTIFEFFPKTWKTHSRASKEVNSDCANFGTHCSLLLCFPLFQPKISNFNTPTSYIQMLLQLISVYHHGMDPLSLVLSCSKWGPLIIFVNIQYKFLSHSIFEF